MAGSLYLKVLNCVLLRLYRVFVHVYVHHFDRIMSIGIYLIQFYKELCFLLSLNNGSGKLLKLKPFFRCGTSCEHLLQALLLLCHRVWLDKWKGKQFFFLSKLLKPYNLQEFAPLQEMTRKICTDIIAPPTPTGAIWDILKKKDSSTFFFFQSHTSLCSHQMNLQVLLPNDSSVRISSQGETTLSPSDHNHSCLSNHTLGKTHHRKCYLLELWFRSNVLRKHCKTAEISKHRLQMWKHGFEIHS